MDYRTKIEDIARRDGVTIGYDAADLFESYSNLPYAYIGLSPWSDDPKTQHQQYWVALHEMGHIATTHFEMDPELLVLFGAGDRVVDAEAEAWQWAIREAGRLDPVGKKVISAAMGTYTGDISPGGDATKKLAERVTGSGAFASHRRDEVESLLA